MTTNFQPTPLACGRKRVRRASERAQADLLCDMELPLSATFAPLGFPLEVRSNDARILAVAAESFGHRTACYEDSGLQISVALADRDHVACPPEPVRRAYDHLYMLLADQRNQSILDLQTGTNFTWVSEGAVRNPLYLRYNFLEKIAYLLLEASVVTDIHAGCVSRNGKGILLCGDSGAGKSTLSYACARAGWTYTSDDTSYLLNASVTPRVVGHSHRVRFRPESRELFRELDHHAITPRMEGKPSIEVSIEELPPMLSATEADVHAVVYLLRTPGASGLLTHLPDGVAMERMCEERYSTGPILRRHEKMLEKLTKIPAFEMRYDSLTAAISKLETLANSL